MLRFRAYVCFLKALRAYDRLRLRVRMALQPGLFVHPDASSNFAAAHFRLSPGARLRIGPGATTERIPGALRFDLDAGASVTIGERVWLRTAAGQIHIAAFEGATIDLDDDAFVNGASLSAKQRVRLRHHAMIGPGSRVYDSDQHDADSETPERSAPVELAEYVWIASDVTVLRGVTVGAHSIVGTRSLVTGDIPPHTLAFGVPARARGRVGDRSNTR